MTVTHSATAAGAGAAQSTAPPENPGAMLGQNDFLKLMIAQLQAQDPLQPGNTNEYISELAQFSEVEQTTNIAQSSQLSGAVQLIGHTVAYDNSHGELAQGKVQSVQAGSPPTLTVEGIPGVGLTSIKEVVS